MDSSVKVDCHDFANAKQAKRSFFRKSRNDKVGGVDRHAKVDSSVKVDCHDFANAKQAKRSFFRKSRNDKVGGVDRHATAAAQYDNNPL